MIVMGIDPGPEESAFVMWDGQKIVQKGDFSNAELIRCLRVGTPLLQFPNVVAIEQIRGFGVMASDKLFDTCWWSGRFCEAFCEDRTVMIPRKVAASHICGTGGISKDQFVREAIIARFGGKDVAIGNKKAPGILYGVAGHQWAALAIALTWWDKNTAAGGAK